MVIDKALSCYITGNMKIIEITLPEWAFLEATSHLGNTLEGRTVLQHILAQDLFFEQIEND